MKETSKNFNSYDEIECPHCNKELGIEGDDLADLITYWGENGSIEWKCNGCDEEFVIKEEVSRSWKVAKTDEDLD